MDAALQHAHDQMADRFVALPRDASLIDVLASILPIDDRVATSWRVWLSVRSGALADPELAEFHRKMYDEWGAELRRRLGPVLPAGSDDPGLPWAVDHVMATIDGIALRATLDRDAWPPERQRSHLAAALTALTEIHPAPPESP